MARIAALVLLVLGLLPLANWIPGGHEAPWYSDRLDLWMSGGAILLGVAAITWITLSRYPRLWRADLWKNLAQRWYAGGWRADVGVVLGALVVYSLIAQTIHSAKPLLIDEIVQVWQARVFATGRLWVPTPEAPEFTGVMHLVDLDGRRFGQFPAGGPAMLMLGSLVHAEWIIGPMCAALGLLAWCRLVRRIEPSQGTALAAILLFGLSPFWVFLAGSMMNHVTATAWIMIGAAALARTVRETKPQLLAALATGLALGIAATIRPMDAMAFALPAGLWLLWRARFGSRQLRELLLSGVGIAIPVGGLLLVNAAQTGDPFLFGYVALWGPSHELGFHATPWGPPHTPLTGLELINLYFLRLQSHFLETPAPAMLFATLGLLLVRRLNAFDRWAIASCAFLTLTYFAYWHDGYYLGPRFFLPLTPWLALWTARFPEILAERFAEPRVPRTVVVTGSAALLVACTQLVPVRATQYLNGMSNLRGDLDSLLTAHEVTTGTLLVRESYGAQLMARLWGVGVGRTEAEGLYRTTDACALDGAITNAEHTNQDPAALVHTLARSRADSTSLRALGAAPDTTLRALPGSTWSAQCIARVTEDMGGFALFAPALLIRSSMVRVVRDLHRRPPDAQPPFYLLRKGTSVDSPFEILPLAADSLDRAWDVDD